MPDPSSDIPKADTPKEKTITMTPSELQKMMDEAIQRDKERNKPDLAKPNYNEWSEVGEDERPNRTATLRLWQKDAKSPWGVIIRADYLKMVFDEETRKHDKMIYEVEVLYDDKTTETFEMSADEYVKLNQVEKVELIDVDRKKMRKITGKVGVPIKDKDGWPVIRIDGGGYGSAPGS